MSENFLLPYENFTNSNLADSIRKADDIKKNGWRLSKYPVVHLTDEIPWIYEVDKFRSWNFHIHCWDMLHDFFMAYSQDKNLDYIKNSLPVALNWITYDQSGSFIDSVNNFAWYDMAVGLRSYRLAYILDVLMTLNNEFENEILILTKSLEKHVEYLTKDENIKFHNNHGFYQIAGQIAVGRRFTGRMENIEAFLLQGKQRLQIMISQQFTDEGVHKEHSPHYHRMVYEALKGIISAGIVDDNEIIQFANQIEDALVWFIQPNGYLTQFGDSDYLSIECDPGEAKQYWNTEEMRYIASRGSTGEPPKENIKAFNDSGYFISRDNWNFKKTGNANASYLAQILCFHSRSHKHADHLSFIWYDQGREILIDAGRYGYAGKTHPDSDLYKQGHWYSDPNRIYCESTRSHNTVEIDGKSFPLVKSRKFGSALKRWGSTENGVIFSESEISVFKSIRFTRVLYFMPGKWLLVYDWLHDNLKDYHNYRQWFHFSPDILISRKKDNYIADIPGCSEKLYISSIINNQKSMTPVFGENNPQKQGWWSPREKEIVPNYAISYENKGASSIFATLFCFADDCNTDYEYSRVNKSGRKGRLRWRANGKINTVLFERPKTGEFYVQWKTASKLNS